MKFHERLLLRFFLALLAYVRKDFDFNGGLARGGGVFSLKMFGKSPSNL
jgi:hypothetical protein